MQGHILVIEDREDIALSYERMLADAGLTCEAYLSACPALEALRSEVSSYDCVITDYQLPDIDGISLIRILQKEAPAIPVILITGHGSVQAAIEAMKYGAYDYLEKPVERASFLKTVHQAISQKQRALDAVTVQSGEAASAFMVGRSSAMIQVYKEIGRVAQFNAPVLIQGATGTGKDLVALAIHHNSARGERPFKAINCSAIPENLLESELFGHEKGAFTGAHQARKGLFEATDGGTLLLDEIGDMPLGLQSKLLRVLQNGCVQRLGGTRDIQVDVRVLAATHRDLKQMIALQDFREDLYHRLAVAEIRLPSLRERPGDLPLLTHYFLQTYARELGLETTRIAPEAIAAIESHDWPGNVRELQNTLRKALMRARNLCITEENIREFLTGTAEPVEYSDRRDPTATYTAIAQNPLEQWLKQRLSQVDWNAENALQAKIQGELESVLYPLLLDALEDNRTRMAQVLGMTRNTLRKRLQELNLG